MKSHTAFPETEMIADAKVEFLDKDGWAGLRRPNNLNETILANDMFLLEYLKRSTRNYITAINPRFLKALLDIFRDLVWSKDFVLHCTKGSLSDTLKFWVKSRMRLKTRYSIHPAAGDKYDRTWELV